ncbi:unnamed protein product [Arctogadus glacialis]
MNDASPYTSHPGIVCRFPIPCLRFAQTDCPRFASDMQASPPLRAPTVLPRPRGSRASRLDQPDPPERTQVDHPRVSRHPPWRCHRTDSSRTHSDLSSDRTPSTTIIIFAAHATHSASAYHAAGQRKLNVTPRHRTEKHPAPNTAICRAKAQARREGYIYTPRSRIPLRWSSHGSITSRAIPIRPRGHQHRGSTRTVAAHPVTS